MTHKRIVTELWIYPVKSLGGIRLEKATVFPKGLEHDRRWMLIDQNNRFLTQREFPVMALFHISQQANGFEVMYENERIAIPFTTLPGKIEATIWNDTVQVLEVSQELSTWFSERLGITCKLVAFPEEHTRAVDPVYGKNNEQVSLADGYPLLVIGQASVDDLNNRLAQPVSMNRFRPNIVFTGGAPYEEDEWHFFNIGSSRFAGVKPCARCTIITVNQETAHKGKEPLATLATYRQNERNKVLFGQNLLPVIAGVISEGDEILIDSH